MSRLDMESILTGLRHARHEAIMSWTGETMCGEEASHLLNAILDVELAIVALERSEEPSEIAGMVATLSSKSRGAAP